MLQALRFCLALFGAGAALAPAAQEVVQKLPRPDRVVIVVEENRAYSRIIGNMAAQYINMLANRGALFTQSFGVTHPSQPNYLALFAGSTMGVSDNSCPYTFRTENLASLLTRAGFTFATYSESMPTIGFGGCMHGHYQRKHNPMVNWQGQNVAPESNLRFADFPADYAKLPTVSFVVPDQQNDMHDGREPDTIIRGDQWLKKNLDGFVQWAEKNNGLLILTFDEDDGSEGNRIATVFVGPMVRQGSYAQRIDHYSVLRTLTDLFGLPAIGYAAKAQPITGVWKIVPAAR
ncbi:MAG: acid phosphatase [Betaproteobacteria bacterium]|nr:acid phosphatase [Betaproteobacteria bacterium]